jgi:hypothetical protein
MAGNRKLPFGSMSPSSTQAHSRHDVIARLNQANASTTNDVARALAPAVPPLTAALAGYLYYSS